MRTLIIFLIGVLLYLQYILWFGKGGIRDVQNMQTQVEKQQREIAHMQDFVRRFRAKATKARQAQSRIKALERMELIAPAHID